MLPALSGFWGHDRFAPTPPPLDPPVDVTLDQWRQTKSNQPRFSCCMYMLWFNRFKFRMPITNALSLHIVGTTNSCLSLKHLKVSARDKSIKRSFPDKKKTMRASAPGTIGKVVRSN